MAVLHDPGDGFRPHALIEVKYISANKATGEDSKSLDSIKCDLHHVNPIADPDSAHNLGYSINIITSGQFVGYEQRTELFDLANDLGVVCYFIDIDQG